MIFNQCPYCGCSLDPNEKCDCQDKVMNYEKAIDGVLEKNKDGQYVLKLEVLSSAV